MKINVISVKPRDIMFLFACGTILLVFVFVVGCLVGIGG